ncbi:hypothetical protein B7992_04340 [Fibrobacter sp. UWH1]|nr:hypothetical protein B7992_04340 [Fibrobacter sp. UWH1]
MAKLTTEIATTRITILLQLAKMRDIAFISPNFLIQPRPKIAFFSYKIALKKEFFSTFHVNGMIS